MSGDDGRDSRRADRAASANRSCGCTIGALSFLLE
jgi:hypothetical protein